MNTTERATINDRSVILDNGSTITLFKSRHLVIDIRDTKDKIQLETNGGTRIVDKEGQIKGFGKVYFNDDGIVNIFAVKDLTKRYRVTYDSNNEDAFIVHIGNQPLNFALINRDYTFLTFQTATWITWKARTQKEHVYRRMRQESKDTQKDRWKGQTEQGSCTTCLVPPQ